MTDESNSNDSFSRTRHTPTGALDTKLEDDEAYCPACNNSFPPVHVTCPNDGARLVKLKASRDPLIGRVFDQRYEIRTTLGEGGMGTVYRGWQLSVDREVAIKVVHPSIASDRTAVKRFLREARLSSRLSQPSIVNVYDFGQTEDGILYLVMELLRGVTLAHELEAQRALPLKRVLTIGLQLCDALQAAHSMGIVHRDLKPGNVVILSDPPGRDLLKVLDFGLAKSLVSESQSSNVTNTNAILGTPLYMSPEQIEGKPTDQRTDIYAMGCMLHQMLTGKPPFLGENANLVLAAHLGDPIPQLPATVPQPLVNTIERMMAKKMDQRLSSAAVIRNALQEILDGGQPLSDLSDTTPDIPREFEKSMIALATTHHAKTGETSTIDAAQVAVSSPSMTGIPAKRSPLILLIALPLLAVAGTAIFFVTRKAPSAAIPPDASLVAPASADAQAPVPAVTPDAAAISVDAPLAVRDAAAPPPIDAGRVRHHDAGTVFRPPPRDAAVVVPHVTPDAAIVPKKPLDAGVDIDFIRVKKDAAP